MSASSTSAVAAAPAGGEGAATAARASSGVVSSSTSRFVAVRSSAAPVIVAGSQQQQQQQEHAVVTTVTGDPVAAAESEEDDDLAGTDEEESFAEEGAMQPEIASQLASAGPTGMAAAAAISSTKKRKRSHSFETNPSIRKRQQTRLLRKLKANIEEYSQRVGQQAVVVVATPGKAANSFRAFGAKPLEDVMRSLQPMVMTELENALERHAPTSAAEDDPNRHELPPLVIDGIPTPVEKMTQAQLRAFIPMMLKYSTGRGKPGWGKESTRPSWWPEGVPWANVRMDARLDDDKQKVSWTHALRQIVINCYRFHNREDLLPSFAEMDEQEALAAVEATNASAHAAAASSAAAAAAAAATVRKVVAVKRRAVSPPPAAAVGARKQLVLTSAAGGHFLASQNTAVQVASNATVLQTISNQDGTVSIVQLDPSTAPGTIIQLPDGTTAQVAAASTETAATGVHTLAEVATAVSAQNQQQQQPQTLELAETATGEITPDGHIIITGDDGQAAYPVSLSGGMITVPVPQGVYQQVVANIQSGEGIQMVQGLQIASSSGGGGTGVVTKLESGEASSSSSQEQQQAAVATPKGLTITPVSTAAASPATASQMVTSSATSSQRKVTATKSSARPDTSSNAKR